MATIQTESASSIFGQRLRPMTSLCALMFLGMLVNCARPAATAPPARRTPTSLSLRATASAEPARTAVQGAVLQRQAIAPGPWSNSSARVTVHNSYLITQYVFIDEIARATLNPNSEQTFEIPPGAHTISVSDSNKREQNAHYVAEVFDVGFEYRYDVVTR